ncbi:MAG: TonB-dependent receptor [Spongiibacteraceae bacterium]
MNKKNIRVSSIIVGSLSMTIANVCMAVSADNIKPLEEIVVTAQKKIEAITDVAATMSLVSSDELAQAHVTNSRDLGVVVSGLSFTEQGGFVQPKIRGIGTSIVGAGADSNVAVYVDGVYISSQSAALFELNSISNIQVLKGPQGSIYGRNATGGAIVITTSNPSFEFEGKAGVSYARYEDVRATAYLSGPLSDKIAANISVVSRNDSGYTTNEYDGDETSKASVMSLRGKLLYNAADNLIVTLSGHYVDQEDNKALSYGPLGGNTPFATTEAAAQSQSGHSKISLNEKPFSDVEGGGGNLKIDYETSWGSIVSITSYSDLSQPFGTDVDATEIPALGIVTSFDQTTYMQELQLLGDYNDSLSWIVGATYYYDESETFGRLFAGAAELPPLLGYVETTAAAVYGEVTYNFWEDWTVIVGGRFSTEEKDAFGTAGVGNPGVVDDSETWDAFTPRLSVRYDINYESSVYASYTEGFKSGLYNLVGLDPEPVEPETINAYEVGYKLETGRVRLTTSAFLYDYQDIQVNAIDNSNSGAGISRVFNAASAEVYGLDFDLMVQVSNSTVVKTGLTYTHAEYEDFPNALVFEPVPGGGNASTFTDVSGNKLERVPEYTAFVAINYTREVLSGDMDVALTASYNDGYFWDAANASRLEQEAFTIVNADISWMPASESYKLSIFGTNLTDEDYYLFTRTSQFGDSASYAKPRSLGVGVEVSF